MKIVFTLCALAFLSACAAPSQTALSDGTMATRIACEGSANGLNYCFERAGKSCGAAGYRILDQNGQVLAKSDVASADAESMVRQYAMNQNSILFQCGT